MELEEDQEGNSSEDKKPANLKQRLVKKFKTEPGKYFVHVIPSMESEGCSELGCMSMSENGRWNLGPQYAQKN